MSFRQDIRHAIRGLLKSPGYTFVAVASLAVGIGANTAIFSVVHGVLLRSLPYPQADRLVTIHEIVPSIAHLYPVLPVNALHYLNWSKNASSFESIALTHPTTMNLTGLGEPEQLQSARISANTLPTLGVQLQLGRNITVDEDQVGRDKVVLISDSLWRSRFNADRSVAGRTINLDGHPYTIIGVMPPRFRLPDVETLGASKQPSRPAQVFKPFAITEDERASMGDFNFGAIARLKPGVTRAQAQAEVDTIQANFARTIPMANYRLGAAVTPLRDFVVQNSRRSLWMLMAAVAAVLLIVCVNIANLLLTRATVRHREFAIRAALGAGTGRLIAAVLGETFVLALAGGAFGIILAMWGVDALVKAAPIDLPRMDDIRIDGWVLAFALGVSTLTAMLCGLLAARKVARNDPQDTMRSGGRTATEAASGLRVRNLLVTVEVAISTVLLALAGLLMSSFVRVLNVDKGFAVEQIVTMDVALPSAKYKEKDARIAFYSRLMPKVSALPAVQSASWVSTLPLQGEEWVDILATEGDKRPVFARTFANYRIIDGNYFRTMRIPMRSGRSFEHGDRDRQVIIISETAADRLFPGQDAVGRKVRRGNEKEKSFEVIGVTKNIRGLNLQAEPGMMAYVPGWYRSPQTASLVIRTAGDYRPIVNAVRHTLRETDSDVPVARVRTMEQVVSESVAERRFHMTLVALFAISALSLASLGIYGVVAYTVARRTNEMGVRIALGATRKTLYRLVLSQGLTPVVAGLVLGIGVALAAGRVISTMLFGVSARDPWTLAMVVTVLATVAAVACWIPARRATRVDPMVALRYE
jgi:predicted permease